MGLGRKIGVNSNFDKAARILVADFGEQIMKGLVRERILVIGLPVRLVILGGADRAACEMVEAFSRPRCVLSEFPSNIFGRF